jgi:3'5'-cyclic nucleotide phosphodiesterase
MDGADHPGVPNATLVKESDPVAVKYKNTSVAEQHSVDLAWAILMRDEYQDLRKCIYTTQAELVRFRQWVVTAVMSTDIVDKGLKELRNARWERAFKAGKVSSASEDSDRKATIVVEHIMQASDVSHTMQHWHVYLKWNKCLFQEMYEAYKVGRSDKDPSTFWYEGEIAFFDFYIIPLAKKLKECGVFGVSSDEYLDYALANRKEWEIRGRGIVDQYVKTCVMASHLESMHRGSAPTCGNEVLLEEALIADGVDC